MLSLGRPDNLFYLLVDDYLIIGARAKRLMQLIGEVRAQVFRI